MPLYAIDDIGDALDATRAFLWPVEWATWVKLSVVAFLVAGPGGGFNVPNLPDTSNGGAPPTEGPPAFDLTPETIAAIAVVALVVLLLVVIFGIIGAIMEFVLVESLRNEEVRLRRYWGRRWRQGVRLFAFRFVFGLLTLLSLAVLAVLVFVPALVGGPGLSVVAGFALVPIAILVLLASGVVRGFTNVFVVPIMTLEDRGVLSAWRRLWPTLRAEWRQYLAYAVAGVVLSIAGSILMGIAVLVGALLLLIPFGVTGALAFFLYSVAPLAGIVVGGLLGIAFVLLIVALIAFAQVPVVVYLRYYALFVLGDTNEEFDLIPERREAVREG